jgi:hypothetical protein
MPRPRPPAPGTYSISADALLMALAYAFGLDRSELGPTLKLFYERQGALHQELLDATDSPSLLAAVLRLQLAGQLKFDATSAKRIPVGLQARRQTVQARLSIQRPTATLVAVLVNDLRLPQRELLSKWGANHHEPLRHWRRLAGISFPRATDVYVLASVCAEMGLIGPDQIPRR